MLEIPLKLLIGYIIPTIQQSSGVEMGAVRAPEEAYVRFTTAANTD